MTRALVIGLMLALAACSGNPSSNAGDAGTDAVEPPPAPTPIPTPPKAAPEPGGEASPQPPPAPQATPAPPPPIAVPTRRRSVTRSRYARSKPSGQVPPIVATTPPVYGHAPEVGGRPGGRPPSAAHPAPPPPPPSPPPPPPPPPGGDMEALPPFALPAPTPSAQMTLGPSIYGAARTLGDLDAMLTGRLSAHGYDASKYYSAPGGFAMVVPIERIRADGEPFPMPKRWSFASSSLADGCTITHLFDCLLHADPGHYRVLVFLATKAITVSAGSAPTFATVQTWTTGNGASFLPESLAAQPLAGRHVVVLVYEFVRPSINAKPQQVTTLSAADHLRAAGLIR